VCSTVTHSGVFEFADAPFAFVIAGGVGWVVNAEHGMRAYQTEQNCLVTAMPIDGHPLVLVADWTRFYLYSLERIVWSSDRIALDGIRFDNTKNGIVNGRCWQPDGWYAFQFKTDPCTVNQGRFITSKWEQ
jgi:hypothetical protein